MSNFLNFSFILTNTFQRSIVGFMSSFCLLITLGPLFIKFAKKYFSSKSREYTPALHKKKDNTATMGGLLIIGICLLTMFLINNLFEPAILLLMLTVVSFGLLGFWDDYSKINVNRGISAKKKFLMQCVISLSIVILLFFTISSSAILIQFLNIRIVVNPLFYCLWGAIVLIATSNAVNITDGLDGLAASTLFINFYTYASLYTLINGIIAIPCPALTELTIASAILSGTCLGFLWFNSYPAQIFMGDVGSLSLGAALGFIALAINLELMLLITGIIFVLETVSVILQVSYYKFMKKRLFRMAPLHHHFELLGWSETTITTRFTIITLISVLLVIASALQSII